jgi:acyl-CoA synthetase (AMP-forming)/AMP-acid ligase II
MDVDYYKRKLRDRYREVFWIQPDAGAIECYGRWHSWRDLARISAHAGLALDDAGIADGAPVGWFARNRPSAIGAVLGILMSGRCCSVLNPHRSEAQLRRDLASTPLAAVIADAEDWKREGVLDAVSAAGIVALQICNKPSVGLLRLNAERVSAGKAACPPELALTVLSSGSSGEPRRVAHGWQELVLMLERSARAGSRSTPWPRSALRSPSILPHSIAHASGSIHVLMAMYEARPVVLFENFSLELWLDAVRRHRPRVVRLVPALLKEVLDSDTTREDLGSLRAVRVSTAPLDADVQRAFERRFGVPVLTDYWSTAFRRVLACWSLDDRMRYAESKRGSAGKMVANIDLRAVHAESGEVLGAGEVGRLEARTRDDAVPWTPTRDLGFVDSDGFVYVMGRAHDAIRHGGYEVLPDAVAAVLRRHPVVRDIAIVGKPHISLGQVPVAFMELSESAATVDLDDIRRWARSQLAPYEIPAEFKVMEVLPRTASLKIDRTALAATLSLGSM